MTQTQCDCVISLVAFSCVGHLAAFRFSAAASETLHFSRVRNFHLLFAIASQNQPERMLSFRHCRIQRERETRRRMYHYIILFRRIIFIIIIIIAVRGTYVAKIIYYIGRVRRLRRRHHRSSCTTATAAPLALTPYFFFDVYYV